MKADRSVSKTGIGNNCAPKATVRSKAQARIGMDAFSKVPALTSVRFVDSPPPIGVASGIRLISKKAASTRSYRKLAVVDTPT